MRTSSCTGSETSASFWAWDILPCLISGDRNKGSPAEVMSKRNEVTKITENAILFESSILGLVRWSNFY